MPLVDVWKRDKGWKVDPFTVTRDDIGKLDEGDRIKFAGDASGLTIVHLDTDSYWHAEPCQLSADHRAVSGTLGETAQTFSIRLKGDDPYTLYASVGPTPEVTGRGDGGQPPAGGNWTAQEGS